MLCDGVLSVLSVRDEDQVGRAEDDDLAPLPLSGSSKLRGAQACCVNENPLTDDPFAVQMCLAKKRQIAVINITEAKLVVVRIRELGDQVRQDRSRRTC